MASDHSEKVDREIAIYEAQNREDARAKEEGREPRLIVSLSDITDAPAPRTTPPMADVRAERVVREVREIMAGRDSEGALRFVVVTTESARASVCSTKGELGNDGARWMWRSRWVFEGRPMLGAWCESLKRSLIEAREEIKRLVDAERGARFVIELRNNGDGRWLPIEGREPFSSEDEAMRAAVATYDIADADVTWRIKAVRP